MEFFWKLKKCNRIEFLLKCGCMKNMSGVIEQGFIIKDFVS